MILCLPLEPTSLSGAADSRIPPRPSTWSPATSSSWMAVPPQSTKGHHLGRLLSPHPRAPSSGFLPPESLSTHWLVLGSSLCPPHRLSPAPPPPAILPSPLGQGPVETSPDAVRPPPEAPSRLSCSPARPSARPITQSPWICSMNE